MNWSTISTAAALLGTILATGVQAQATGDAPQFAHWDEAQLSQPVHKVRMEHHVPVPMRDGTALSADIYRPDASGKFPVLLLRTPYSNNAQDEIQDSKWYAERGYVVVNQDVRGRYDSDGQFDTYRNEADDGFDTDEWIAQQPWSNGRIGTVGGSYLGYTQLTQAIRGSQHLKAVAADFTSSNIHDGWVYVDGAFVLGFALPWGATTVDGHTNQGGLYDWPAIVKHLPIATADEAAGHHNRPYRDWLAHPNRNDPYWNNISFEREVNKIAAPVLVIQGWYDIFLRGALRDDMAIRKSGATELARSGKRLMIGPWTHSKGGAGRISNPMLPRSGPDRSIDFGPDAALEWKKIYLRWHDHWLKGIDNGVDTEPPVKLFVMGENRWRYEQEWPLARTRYTRYYLRSGGKANTAAGDGGLDIKRPAGAGTDSYIYDPADPVPTLGGNICCSFVPGGTRNHEPVETRADVLVYTTAALTEAVEVTGPITMKLFAATTAKDTDWVARLIDVHPDGYARNLQDGIVRARYRQSQQQPAALIEPGKVYEYDIDMWATSNVFQPGHRIRIEITSSNFPRFDRNLNTGEDPATGTRMEKAQQTIHHSAKYPSHVVLPIVPKSRS